MLKSSMSLSEIHKTIMADMGFIAKSFAEAGNSFKRELIFTSNFPFSKTYDYECGKSHILYSFTVVAPNSREIKAAGISSSYKNDEGLLTGIVAAPQKGDLVVHVFNPHCIAQYRELGLQNNGASDEEVWQIMRSEVVAVLPKVEGVSEIDNNLLEHVKGDVEHISAVTTKGVFFGARSNKNKLAIEFGDFCTLDMLSKDQYDYIFNTYLQIYMQQYIVSNPKKALEFKREYQELTDKFQKEHWTLGEFAEEGKKLIEKFPLNK